MYYYIPGTSHVCIKRETFLCSKPLNYYSAVIAFASEGYTNIIKKLQKNYDNSTLNKHIQLKLFL